MKKIVTEIVKINPAHPEPDTLAVICRTLKAKGVMAYPTETFYGLGGDCFDKEVIKRIYDLKKRETAKPFPIIVSDTTMAANLSSEIPPSFTPLTNRFWPGPLTLVLKASPLFPRELVGNRRSIGMRVPGVLWLQELVRCVGFPLIATSANIAGEGEISLPEEIIRIFDGKVELIIDGGKTPGRLPSTVVDLTSETPALLREGAIPGDEIRKALSI